MHEEELPEGALFDPFRGVTYARGSLYELAEWYDVDYAAFFAEEPFYRMLAEQHVGPGQAYVELGAGTGRLCIRMADRGVRVHAVEPAEGMRRRLERWAQNLDEDAGRLTVEARSAHDFEGPDDAEPALIALPLDGVLHVFGAEALRAVLGRCRDKLAPEGRVALDITSPSWEAMARRGLSWGRVDDRVHPKTGARIVTCDKSEYDDATRVLRTTYLFVEEGGRAARVFIEQYMWTYQELLHALEESGFTVDLVFGNVDFAPFEEKSPRLLVSARRR